MIDGAVHPYVGASSACWTRFAELGVTLPAGGTPLRRLVTDAYMVQHPGVPERRAIQSVGLHLVALSLVLEGGLPPDLLSATLQRALERPPAWRWLEPPVPNGSSTVVDLEASIGADRTAGCDRGLRARRLGFLGAAQVDRRTVGPRHRRRADAALPSPDHDRPPRPPRPARERPPHRRRDRERDRRRWAGRVCRRIRARPRIERWDRVRRAPDPARDRRGPDAGRPCAPRRTGCTACTTSSPRATTSTRTG